MFYDGYFTRVMFVTNSQAQNSETRVVSVFLFLGKVAPTSIPIIMHECFFSYSFTKFGYYPFKENLKCIRCFIFLFQLKKRFKFLFVHGALIFSYKVFRSLILFLKSINIFSPWFKTALDIMVTTFCLPCFPVSRLFFNDVLAFRISFCSFLWSSFSLFFFVIS